jgi:hypothetical protein
LIAAELIPVGERELGVSVIVEDGEKPFEA